MPMSQEHNQNTFKWKDFFLLIFFMLPPPPPNIEKQSNYLSNKFILFCSNNLNSCYYIWLTWRVALEPGQLYLIWIRFKKLIEINPYNLWFRSRIGLVSIIMLDLNSQREKGTKELEETFQPNSLSC